MTEEEREAALRLGLFEIDPGAFSKEDQEWYEDKKNLRDRLLDLIYSGEVGQARELCLALDTTIGASMFWTRIHHSKIPGGRKSGRTSILCKIANEASAAGRKCIFWNIELNPKYLRGTFYNLDPAVIIRTHGSWGEGEFIEIE